MATETECPTLPQYALRESATPRERIVAEVIRRLKCGLVTRRSTPPIKRQWEGVNVSQVPSANVFEDLEQVATVRRLMYEKTLPLWIALYRPASKRVEVQEQGNPPTS